VPDDIAPSEDSQDRKVSTETAEQPSRRLGRRTLVLGAATAGVGAAVSIVARPEVANAASPDGGGKVVLGKANTATATTSISIATNGGAGIEGVDTSHKGGYGVSGVSTSGYGVSGVSTGSTGIYGFSSNGDGVVGITEANGQVGVAGSDLSASGGYGVFGTSSSGKGVYGQSTYSDGLHGQTSGAGACGVYGYDGSTDGGYGVNGQSNNGTGVYGTSTSGTGVSGIHSTGLGSGVSGTDDSDDANSCGVLGKSVIGYGVFGTATGEDGCGVLGSGYGPGVISFGVYAYSENSDALYVEGDAVVTNTLSKGGGSFKIDHPVDPEGKYLYHSFVESPDMMNVYNGTVGLDGNGRATVELPDWFEALNRDFRYQLTAIGGPAPDLHISGKVVNGKFAVAGGKANQEVSWQVTGIRQDAWANANRIPVEVDKKEEDQGRYLHPELFGGEPVTTLAKTRDRVRRHH